MVNTETAPEDLLCTITGRVTGRNSVCLPGLADTEGDPGVGLPGAGADGTGEDGTRAVAGAEDGAAAAGVDPAPPEVGAVPASADFEPAIPLDGGAGVVMAGADRPADPVEIPVEVAVAVAKPALDPATAAVPDEVEVHPATRNTAASSAAKCSLVRFGAAGFGAAGFGAAETNAVECDAVECKAVERVPVVRWVADRRIERPCE